MTDTIQHVLGGIVLTLAAYVLVALLPNMVACAIIASAFILLREVTQEQTKNYDSDFTRGWDFWNWSNDKNVETWVPIAALIIVSILY